MTSRYAAFLVTENDGSPRAAHLHDLRKACRAASNRHVRGEPLYSGAVRGVRAVAGDQSWALECSRPSQYRRRCQRPYSAGDLDGSANTASDRVDEEVLGSEEDEAGELRVR